jgi:hypothetical protein
MAPGVDFSGKCKGYEIQAVIALSISTSRPFLCVMSAYISYPLHGFVDVIICQYSLANSTNAFQLRSVA